MKQITYFLTVLACLMLVKPGDCLAQSESSSQASSQASWDSGFPVQAGTSILMPGMITDYLPRVRPNPLFKNKPKVVASTTQHEVVAQVKNYHWPQKSTQLP